MLRVPGEKYESIRRPFRESFRVRVVEAESEEQTPFQIQDSSANLGTEKTVHRCTAESSYELCVHWNHPMNLKIAKHMKVVPQANA
jgi:hypothetical protein